MTANPLVCHSNAPRKSPHGARLSCAAMLCLLASCGSLPKFSFFKNPADEAVVYALASREGVSSPLNGTLKPACPALPFDGGSIHLTSTHEHAVQSLVKDFKQQPKARLLIVGYTQPNLPHDHARAISDRRSLAVRQRLIELGMEPANLQTVGFGNDFAPTGPSSDVVVIYKQN